MNFASNCKLENTLVGSGRKQYTHPKLCPKNYRSVHDANPYSVLAMITHYS